MTLAKMTEILARSRLSQYRRMLATVDTDKTICHTHLAHASLRERMTIGQMVETCVAFARQYMNTGAFLIVAETDI
jgi:hypothetical protein